MTIEIKDGPPIITISQGRTFMVTNKSGSITAGSDQRLDKGETIPPKIGLPNKERTLSLRFFTIEVNCSANWLQKNIGPEMLNVSHRTIPNQ